MEHTDKKKYTLTATTPDQLGLIASITNCIAQSGGNILNLAQQTSADIKTFFCRVSFAVDTSFCEDEFSHSFSLLSKKFNITWNLYPHKKKQRMAIMVSKTSHCLYEVMLKHQDGFLHCDIPLIISNHPDLEIVAAKFNVPYFKVDPSKGKAEYEADVQKMLDDYKIDVICLARYMQILSPEFTRKWENKIINIHHGFLPAFKGAKPYHQAWNKGVKIIGATAHFANEDLDQGPIIFQDVKRIKDTQSIKEFVAMGKDIERIVLVEALKRYFDHNIFLYNGRTFIIEN
ncbi:MAG TPA: formyltetrahydrofolate deformylase [Treponemataceae bacterium]|nr:formyltetrahydrofolate deformylase [Treponemataceae bacterium]